MVAVGAILAALRSHQRSQLGVKRSRVKVNICDEFRSIESRPISALLAGSSPRIYLAAIVRSSLFLLNPLRSNVKLSAHDNGGAGDWDSQCDSVTQMAVNPGPQLYRLTASSTQWRRL